MTTRLRNLSCACRPLLAGAAILCIALATPCPGLSIAKAGANGSDQKQEMQRNHPVIVSTWASHDIRPDGNLKKPFWSAAQRVSFDQAAFVRTSYPQLETQVASRWTRDYLYLAFWCHYETLNVFEGEDPHKERWGLWEKDVVEAFIAPDSRRPSHYFEFEVAPNNQWIDLEIDLTKKPFNDPQWNSGFDHVTRVDAAQHVWTSEWRIPIAALTSSGIARGEVWHLNFYRSDGTDPHRHNMSWGALPQKLPQNSFHQPKSFGTVHFVKSHAPGRDN